MEVKGRCNEAPGDSPGANISLIGQNSMSASVSPATSPSRIVTAPCAMCEEVPPRVMTNADLSPLSEKLLTLLKVLPSSPFKPGPTSGATTLT